ncbi:MAG TPA: hypothetical protein VFQ45_00805 [Longimicrobium sp.]|nr:hypothetical protein [Longimicrobium sp.]
MQKVKLDLDALEVESFETAPESVERGTIYGHATLVCTDQFSCTTCDIDDSNVSWGYVSCGATCGGDCGPQTYAMHSCEAWQSCNVCEM